MIVEIIGPTSSGKSTLARKIVLKDLEIRNKSFGQFPPIVLGYMKGGSITSILLRDLKWGASFFLNGPSFFSTACILFECLRRNDSILMRANLFRNYVRKQGHTISLRRTKNKSISLLDEGSIHATNNVFSHYDNCVDGKCLPSITSSIQAPDVIIKVSVKPESMIKRANSRDDSPWKELEDQQWANIHSSTEKNYSIILSTFSDIPVINVDSENYCVDHLIDALHNRLIGLELQKESK